MNVPLLIMNAASAGPIVEVVVDGASVAGLEVDTDGAASCWFVSPAHRVPADGVPYLEHGIGSFGAFFAWTAGRPVGGLGCAIHAAARDVEARGRAGGTWLADTVRPVPLSPGEASVVVDVLLRYCDAEALELEGADVGAALARARPAERLASRRCSTSGSTGWASRGPTRKTVSGTSSRPLWRSRTLAGPTVSIVRSCWR